MQMTSKKSLIALAAISLLLVGAIPANAATKAAAKPTTKATAKAAAPKPAAKPSPSVPVPAKPVASAKPAVPVPMRPTPPPTPHPSVGADLDFMTDLPDVL